MVFSVNEEQLQQHNMRDKATLQEPQRSPLYPKESGEAVIPALQLYHQKENNGSVNQKQNTEKRQLIKKYAGRAC